MLTDLVKDLKKEHSVLFDRPRDNIINLKLTNLSYSIWVELITNCDPTYAEFHETTLGITVTTNVIFLIMKKAGFWNDDNN